MPCVSRFYGIVIYIYTGDHNPPHFHAKYAGQDAAIEITSLRLLVGSLPARALKLTQEWAAQHQTELLNAWVRAQAGQAAGEIEPLP